MRGSVIGDMLAGSPATARRGSDRAAARRHRFGVHAGPVRRRRHRRRATTGSSPPACSRSAARASSCSSAGRQVGGAAITEQPWGPDYKVTVAVVRRQPDAADDPARARARAPRLPRVPAARVLRAAPRRSRRCSSHRESIGAVLATRRRRVSRVGKRGSRGLADVLGPLLTTIPPRARLAAARRPRRPGAARVAAAPARRARRRATSPACSRRSIADLLDDWFESPQMQGVLSVSGVIGTWAGPRSAGTAYVMAHHKIGDVGRRRARARGASRAAAWAASRAALRARGGVVRRDGPHRRERRADRRARRTRARRRARVGRGAARRRRDRRDAPEDHVPRPDRPRRRCPTTSSTTIERWKTRSGTVKVNVAVDRLPEFRAKPGFDPEVHGGTIVLAEIARRHRGRVPGRGRGPRRGAAVRRHLHPVGVRRLARARRATTSCRCSRSGCRTNGRRSPNARRARRRTPIACIARVEAVAPGFTDSILHRQVIGPYEMEHEYGLVGGNIFHGELSPGQLFHMRPAPGLRRLPHADRGPVPGEQRDPRRRRRHRHPRNERRRSRSCTIAGARGGGVRRRASSRSTLRRVRRAILLATAWHRARGRGSGAAHDRRHRADRFARPREGDDATRRARSGSSSTRRSRRSPSTTLDVRPGRRRRVDRRTPTATASSTRCVAATWSDGQPVTAADVVASLHARARRGLAVRRDARRTRRASRSRRPHTVAITSDAGDIGALPTLPLHVVPGERRSCRRAVERRLGVVTDADRRRSAHGGHRPARAGPRSTRSCSAPTATPAQLEHALARGDVDIAAGFATDDLATVQAIDGGDGDPRNDGDQWFLQAQVDEPDRSGRRSLVRIDRDALVADAVGRRRPAAQSMPIVARDADWQLRAAEAAGPRASSRTTPEAAAIARRSGCAKRSSGR